jgi:hypothetical protein
MTYSEMREAYQLSNSLNKEIIIGKLDWDEIHGEILTQIHQVQHTRPHHASLLTI